MKIKVCDKSYTEVKSMTNGTHIRPIRQLAFWRKILKAVSAKELKDTGFTCEYGCMDGIGPKEPVLYLMNHSSFTDLQIASTVLADRHFHIVMTNDGMVGKAGLMRRIGCIPTRKFIMDTTLVKDMLYTVKSLKSSILMYPEASYSFDGTETPLPESLGKCIKLLNVPVVMIRTHGAFLRDPLYNCLQKRKVSVSAEIYRLFSLEEISSLSVEDINSRLREAFHYDHFREQSEREITVSEPFRADGLNRVLYKCVNCLSENTMKASGDTITCSCCGETHKLLENGRLFNTSSDTKFEYIPDWYAWEREMVRGDIRRGEYKLETPVDIMMLVDFKSIYRVGEGILKHNTEGFRLTGCDGKLDFTLSPKKTYSLYSDYYWYEIGDMISIGDSSVQYYCFPKTNIPVAKVRLATEELFKIQKK